MLTEEQNKRIGYLQNLCNKYGDFKVAIAGKNKTTGEMFWSKHRSVLECWESEQGIWFLGQANNRQILKAEMVIDLDTNPTLDRMNKICDHLEEMSEHYKAYFTGSKGYHIHVWDNKLGTYSKQEKERIRKLLLTVFKADVMKKDEVMIALEDAPHWKTGNTKTLVREYPTWAA